MHRYCFRGTFNQHSSCSLTFASLEIILIQVKSYNYEKEYQVDDRK